MAIPAATTELLREHAALTTGVGVADVSTRCRIELTGADRAAFLHSFCTNEIKKLVAGQGCEAFVTNHQGKTVGHVYVFCRTDSLVLDTTAGQAPILIPHLERFVISERVEFHDRTSQWSSLLVAGLQAEQLLERLCGTKLPAPVLSHADSQIADRAVTICRVDFAGPDSFFLRAAVEDAPAVRAALQAGGAMACGPEAVEMARIEAGTPLFGIDVTDDNLPQEVARDTRAISFQKGCYLGQETVARIDALGHVNRMLSAVRLDGDSIPPPGTELFAGEKLVGQVTSAAFSPRLQAAIALGYIRRMQAAPGTRLHTVIAEAEVIRLPVA